MQIRKEFRDRNSVNIFRSKLDVIHESGNPLISITTSEPYRALSVLREYVLSYRNKGKAGSKMEIYKEWDVVNGFRDITLANMQLIPAIADRNPVELSMALDEPYNYINSPNSDPETFAWFVYFYPHYWMQEGASVVEEKKLIEYASYLFEHKVRIVMITPSFQHMDSLRDCVINLTLSKPGFIELREYMNIILDAAREQVSDSIDDLFTEEFKTEICYSATGMSKEGFEFAFSSALIEIATKYDVSSGNDFTVDMQEEMLHGIISAKTKIVEQSGILEIMQTTRMEDVGGMDRLKDWVKKREKCYSDEAEAFGLEPPKGLMMVGIPGVGKSTCAKAIAATMKIPLLRLDFGRVFNSFVGKSEERIREALAMASSMAPCVLFCDEIDKGIGGTGRGGGDAGTSERVLGSFLTWLQENKAPVFTIATANDISSLPSALLRRGRFDAIFFAGLPNDDERKDVLDIHLRKRGYCLNDYDDSVIDTLVDITKGYVPSEIESAIKDALVTAFYNDDTLDAKYIIEELRNIVPLSVSRKEEIDAALEWSRSNAISTSYPAKAKVKVSSVSAIGRKRTRFSTNKSKKDED